MKLFWRYIRELLTGWFGILADISTALWIVSYFVPAIAAARGAFFLGLAIAFFISGYRVFHRQEDRLTAREQQHAATLTALKQGDAAEVAKLTEEINRLRGGFENDTFRLAESHYTGLNTAYKDAIKYLLVAGDSTDAQAVAQLRRIGYGSDYSKILEGVSRDTPFVQRVQHERQQAEHVTGYTGLYTISPTFRVALTKLVAEDPELRGHGH